MTLVSLDASEDAEELSLVPLDVALVSEDVELVADVSLDSLEASELVTVVGAELLPAEAFFP